MDALCRAIGAEALVTLAGQEYLLAPMTLGTIGLVENFLLLRRTLPTDTIRPMLVKASPAARRQLFAMARTEMRGDLRHRIVTTEEFSQFIDSSEGIIFTAWACLRVNYPAEFRTRRATEAVLESGTKDEIVALVRARDAISGLGLLNDLDWRQATDMMPPEAVRRRVQRSRERGALMPWRANFRALAEEAGIPIETLKGLTLYQYRILCVAKEELSSIVGPSKPGKSAKAQAAEKPIIFRNDGEWRKQVHLEDVTNGE